jgi:subtilisin family serine protease
MSIALSKKAFFLWMVLSLIMAQLLYGGELPYREGEVLVRFKKQIQRDFIKQRHVLSAMNMEVIRYYPLNAISLVKMKVSEPVQDSIKRLKGNAEVDYAEPNYKRYLTAVVPNDPLFSSQWALQNIQSTEAWHIERGERSIVIAFADTGIDYMHEDLRNNLWKNFGEDWIASSPGYNGVDDDGDGYIDNYFGINTITGSGDPLDDESHGTHVSGIAGAQGNNFKGVSGVNWKVSIMALKFIGSDGYGTVADEIEAIEFARMKAVKVFNMSFAGAEFSTFERDALESAEEILFIAAAGNGSVNNDMVPCYPASYDLPNIVSVAASDEFDNIAFFSNYGKNTVSLVAPGMSILSTLPGDNYDTFSGSSMSTSHVSGLAALVLARSPWLSVSQLKDQILRTVDTTPDLEEKTLTGGRINVYRALTESVTAGYIYSILPERGPVGSEVAIRGSNFKDAPGTVLFEGGLQAPISSWRNDKIVCQVPEGATTGLVHVITEEGTSNGVSFEVTLYPTMVSFSFAYASTEEGQNSYIVLSNPFDYPVTIYVKAVGTSGDNTLKIITLNAYEKLLWNLTRWGILNETLFITCESEEFFAAALLIFNDDLTRLISIPHIMGGPISLYDVKRTR